MSDLLPETLERIESARTVFGRPPGESMVPYASVLALLSDQADRLEDKPFLVYYSDEGYRREYSYREFHEEVVRTAMYLAASGIAAGDRIAVMSYNHADVVVQYFAAWAVGACVVPINAGEDDRRISYILQDSEVKLALVRDEYLERFQMLGKGAPTLTRIVQVGKRSSGAFPHLGSELERQPARLALPRMPALQDEALIVYTSGTTGNPKGVVLDQYNLLVDAMAIAEWHQVSESETMMCVLPLHHVNGIVVTVLTPLYGGSTIVLNQRFHPERFFERIAAEHVAIVSVVPTILQFLIHAKLDMAAYKLQNFRHFICGAGPLTVELATKFEHQFKMPIVHGYGLSETTCYSCFLPIDLEQAEHRSWMSGYGFPSIGVPLPVNEMTIQDADGNEVAEGQKGEIVIRGHNVMTRYFRNPEVNTETFKHGWFRSGDEGFYRLDEQGRSFFFITGRIKELIIRGGVNISPFEIDEVLMHMPGIEAAIAVGFENDWYGEEVGALVKLKAGSEISETQILSHCRKHLPYAKAPKVISFAETIPVTSTGKYQRTLCKSLFAQWKSVQFSEQR